jgi:Holliday junction DNA helicase RuvA
MYVFIKGILAQTTPIGVTIEVHGIGYRVIVPANVLSKLPHIGESLMLHTSFVIRENAQALYGFMSEQDRDLFEAFLNVSGIGPKIALSLIGHMSVHDIGNAILRSDIAMICKVPGIGKKTAERLIIEMRDKLPALLPPMPSGMAFAMPVDPQSRVIQDAMSALIHLGYNQATAQKAIKKTLNEEPAIEDLPTLITAALKNV